MNQRVFLGPIRSTTNAVLAFAMLAAMTVVVAGQGSAGAQGATTCERIASGTTLVTLGDGGPDVLSIRTGRLFVNGRFCDRPTFVFVQDGAEQVSSDHVVIEVGAGWFQRNGERIALSTNLRTWPEGGAPDRVDIRGTNGVDRVVMSARAISFVERGVPFGALTMDLGGVGDLRVDLRGGNDRLAIDTRNAIFSYSGTLRVTGGRGNDRLSGTGPVEQTFVDGSQTFIGGPGNDRLLGKGGDDVLLGSGGNDVIIGGPGADIARGGGGDDRFSMRDGAIDVVNGGSGTNTCTCDPDDRTSGF